MKSKIFRQMLLNKQYILKKGMGTFLFLQVIVIFEVFTLFAFIFMYKGIANLFSALNMVSTHRYWWLYLVNGLLLLILGLLFFASPFTAAFSIIFLCAAAFIYWGFSLIFFGYSLRPVEQQGKRNYSVGFKALSIRGRFLFKGVKTFCEGSL